MPQLSTLTPPAANPARACPPWCAIHDDGFDLCVALDVHQDFGDRGPQLDVCHDARTTLTRDPDHGDRVGLSINGHDATEFDLDQATAIAHAILAQVATARRRHDDAQLHHTLATGDFGAPITKGMHVTFIDRSGVPVNGTVECEPYPFGPTGALHTNVIQDNTQTRAVWSYVPVTDLRPATGLQDSSASDPATRIPAQRVSHDRRASVFTALMSDNDKQRAAEREAEVS